MTRNEYQHLHHQHRMMRRQNRTYLIIAAICLGLAASQLWRAERNAVRNDALQETIAEVQTSVSAYPVAMYGLSYALTAEQAKAGEYEAKLIEWRGRAKSAEGQSGYWKRTAGEHADRICMLEQMLRDNGVRLYQRSECGEG